MEMLEPRGFEIETLIGRSVRTVCLLVACAAPLSGQAPGGFGSSHPGPTTPSVQLLGPANSSFLDCNANGIPDDRDILLGISSDANLNGIPDECEIEGPFDCNDNRVPDVWDIINGTSLDCNCNGVPDECEIGVEPCTSGGMDNFTPIEVVGGKAIATFSAVCGGQSATEAITARALPRRVPAVFVVSNATLTPGAGLHLVDGRLRARGAVLPLSPQITTPDGVAVLTEPLDRLDPAFALPGEVLHVQCLAYDPVREALGIGHLRLTRPYALRLSSR